MSCVPIEWTGFSEVIGSWKIIAMSLPRMSRSRRAPVVSRFSPLKSASPLVIVFLRSFRPMIVRQVTLLPEPDSPTMPSVLPFSTLKLTPSTALTIPSSVWKYVFRSLTSRRATFTPPFDRRRAPSGQPDSWVDPGVEEVDQQVEHDDRDGSEDNHPHDDRQVGLSDRANQELAEPRQVVDRLREDRAAQADPDVHAEHRHDRQQGVAENVRADHARLGRARRARGTHVVLGQPPDHCA